MLKTDYEVGTIPFIEYPRPQLKRDSYINLNGVWKLSKLLNGQTTFEGDILVPFSPESLNSGIGNGFCLSIEETLVYERKFVLDKEFIKDITFMNFGAVDQECSVFVNGVKVGSHRGGYTPFSVDISNAVVVGENTVRVECKDYTELSQGARGKQSSNAEKIWYSPQSGIWQTVWLESLVKDGVKDLTVKTDSQRKTVTIKTDCLATQTLTVFDGETQIFTGEFVGEISFSYDFVLWCPENPKLYDFTITTNGGDKISSYFGVRSFGVGVDSQGKKRLMLNGKPYFMNGVLDQGYWADGLLTPPSNKAMYDEVKLIKDMGFNMIRKHIKLEPLTWYHYCDKLGLIVWQDFVNGGGEYKFSHIALMPFLGFNHKDNDYKYFSRTDKLGREEFINSVHETVATLKNSVSIGVWVPFNEGWGQFDSYEITKLLTSLDDSRIIDSVSGWHDQGKKKTTLKSMHIYYTPLKVPKDERAVVLSEFGGYSIKTEGHVFSEKEFGYKVFKNPSDYKNAIKKLFLTKLKPLIKKGLSASVYTQVSDVEEEINGLITYDRKVVKVPVEFMKEINLEIEREANEIK